MALSPPPLSRSPASSLNTDLSSPDLGDTHYKLAALYQQACGMDHHLDSEPLSLDAASSAEWHTTLLHPTTAATTTTTAADGSNMLTAPYDTFHNGYDSSLQPEYPHAMYTTAHQHHSLSPQPYSRTMSHSPAMAQRHFYSYRPSDSPQPRVKMENGSDYPDPELSRYPSPHAGPSMPVEIGSYSSAASSSGYLSDAPSSSMAGHEYTHLDNASFASIASAPSQAHNSGVLPYRVARPARTKTRKLTTKEDANYQCEVPGCGKLFSRSYNYKAHMATHDEHREYPFPCTVGDCNKKFVRKTDLTRHHQSVHMREKNHRCDYCARSFARRDTLRRHMEDGCAKRFDIGTLDVRAEGYDSSFGSRPASHLLAPPTQLPPMTNSRPRSPNSNLLEPSISLMRRGY